MPHWEKTWENVGKMFNTIFSRNFLAIFPSAVIHGVIDRCLKESAMYLGWRVLGLSRAELPGSQISCSKYSVIVGVIDNVFLLVHAVIDNVIGKLASYADRFYTESAVFGNRVG